MINNEDWQTQKTSVLPLGWWAQFVEIERWQRPDGEWMPAEMMHSPCVALLEQQCLTPGPIRSRTVFAVVDGSTGELHAAVDSANFRGIIGPMHPADVVEL